MGKRGEIDVKVTSGCDLNWSALTVARASSPASSSSVSLQGRTRTGRLYNPQARMLNA
jgi:poly(3-hydroxybutyrate) depolymerase